VPVGAEPFRFDEKSPLVASAKEIAAKHRVTQDCLSDFCGLYAREQTEAMTRLANARRNEVAALGPMASERVSAVTRFLQGTVGEADAKPLLDSIWTSSAVRSWETLITKLARGHGSSFSSGGRDPGAGRGMDPKTYEALSMAQRMAYARTGDPNNFG
jgi:hypothetical protein